MLVAFVADGGPQTGLGHVYECVTLANRFESDEVKFFLQSGGPAADVVTSSGYDPLVVRDDSDLPQRILDVDPDTVVFDHPALSLRQLASVEATVPGSRIVTIGNLQNNLPLSVGEHADVVVNFWKHLGDGRSDRRLEDGTLYLEGPGFLLFRDDFFPYQDAWRPGESLDRVMILFGGSDPSNHTTWAVRELLDGADQYTVEVVLGPGFDHDDELHEVLSAADLAAHRVVRDVDDVARRMARTDVLLASPGMTTFEALFVGCPILSINQTVVHRETFDAFEFARDRGDIDDLSTAIGEVYRAFSTGSMGIDVGHRYEELLASISGDEPAPT